MAKNQGNQDKAIQVQSGGALALSNEEDRRAAQLFKLLLPYGRNLSDDNALALAVYSKLHGLDAHSGECYYLVRVKDDGSREEMGVYPGIKGYRKKAKEQLTAIQPEAHYTIQYDVVDSRECGIDPGTVSICVKAILRDSISKGRYIVDSIKLAQAGFNKKEIEDMIGRPPIWVGYGYVKKTETYIRMSPLALAKKRAEADATKQRFDLPFEELAEGVAPDASGVQEDQEVNDQEKSGEKRKSTEEELNAALGFVHGIEGTAARPSERVKLYTRADAFQNGDQEQGAKTDKLPNEEEITDGEFKDVDVHQNDPDPSEEKDPIVEADQRTFAEIRVEGWPADAKVSIETAKMVKRGDGLRYLDLSDQELKNVVDAIDNSLKDEKAKKLSESARDELLFKKDTALVCLAASASAMPQS